MKRRSAFSTFEQATSQTWFAYTLLALRLALGVMFLYAGISKLGDWTAVGYLEAATGPLAEWFQSMAGSVLVDQLNIWGQILIGVALIIGACVRPASFFGIVMMLLYYFAQFEQNTAHGLIDAHIINVVVFILFLAGGVGHIFGLNELLTRGMKKTNWLVRFLFG